jgi:hypothetical protein
VRATVATRWLQFSFVAAVLSPCALAQIWVMRLGGPEFKRRGTLQKIYPEYRLFCIPNSSGPHYETTPVFIGRVFRGRSSRIRAAARRQIAFDLPSYRVHQTMSVELVVFCGNDVVSHGPSGRDGDQA